ncbi:MAG: heavy metal translocating P-type ATPase [Acidobacteria bacterium]|nr:heavy metal translocating P-type ATPase [Acidobacteriota bacterium]
MTMARPGREATLAALAIIAIGAHLALRWFAADALIGGLRLVHLPLLVALILGGGPLVWSLLRQVIRGNFSADLLAGISIVTSVVLGEYLAGTLVVLMLSGGQALEAYAVRRASSALAALARRMPTSAHRKVEGAVEEVPLDRIAPGDTLVVFPHEICPVDGTVLEGQSTMDESYLTGEPYRLSKVAGTQVLSGAINGDEALMIRADRTATDSRYARIMQVMHESEQRRPALRRLGDQLGAFYTPLALAIAAAAWVATGDPSRFLAVLVVATPCPLLIAIPVAIIGSVSLAARRGIVIRDPAVLEQLDRCRTAIFDKTGTLTYGRPLLTATLPAPDADVTEVLSLVASVEQYSRHPLASAILEAGRAHNVPLREATRVSERPGQGLTGDVAGHTIRVTSRKALLAEYPSAAPLLPPSHGGLECVVLVDEAYAATLQFRDEPRMEGRLFVQHLGHRHGFTRALVVSGDRDSEVRYLADLVGIAHVHASQSPEQKVEIVRAETLKAPTLFIGDGINDAPALATATVGIAFGQASEVITEAAGAVILDSMLERVDELLHIGRRMRRIALQSAVGGMALSVVGMAAAAIGLLPPVAGALTQEAIDIIAVVNALRAALPPRTLKDY